MFDGSVHYISIISFGWILANPEDYLLAAGSGPIMDWVSSLRVEGEGILSGVFFFSIIAHKYPSTHCTIKYISDNFGLIQKNYKHLDYDIPYPNTTLQSEFEIIE